MPIPHQNASGSRSPSDRENGPPRPSANAGMRGHGIRWTAPRSRRAKATTPTANSATVSTTAGMSDAQSNWLTSGW